MRILHTSDWHLGQHFYGKTRAAEHKKFLDWLLEQVKKHDVDAIIVAGDIFDTGVPPSYAREMYFDFISACHQASCQLIVLAGNHDSPAMLGESKQVLSRLSTRVIPVASTNLAEQVFVLSSSQTSHTESSSAPSRQAVICAIPFIRPRDIMISQAGESAADKQQQLQNAISLHYQGLYEHAQTLANQHTPALPIIATGHLTAVGASTSDSVRDIYIGTLEAFPAQAFPPADYIALGHIHQAQKVAKSEFIRYCGSPIPLSFDEVKQDKTVVLVDFSASKSAQNSTEQNTPAITELIVPRFQAMQMLKTNLDDVVEAVTNSVSSLPEGETLWLDIEIDSHDYIQDTTARITELTKTLPVEVLVVRRSKKARSTMPSQQKKITLNELSLTDVFNTRLEAENWEHNAERKARVSALFQSIVADVEQQKTTESLSKNITLSQQQSDTEKTPAVGKNT